MARILITGGAGYVGSHCAKALAAAGHEGVVFDSLLFGHREFVRWGPLIEGDIRDAAALDAVFSDYRFDAVMHFAALAYCASFYWCCQPPKPFRVIRMRFSFCAHSDLPVIRQATRNKPST